MMLKRDVAAATGAAGAANDNAAQAAAQVSQHTITPPSQYQQ